MRSLHFLVKMVVTAAIIASCVFVFMYPVSDLWTILTENIPDNDLYRQGLAILAGVAVFLAFLPLWPKRKAKQRTYTFQGTHGEVVVELEPVEATLERVVNKLPEVKWATVRIRPVDGTPPAIQVDVKGVFRREDASDVRLTSAWIQSFIKTRTQKMLGVQDVNVRLHLKSQITNMKSVKPEPLLLEGPSQYERHLPTASQTHYVPETPTPAPEQTAPPQHRHAASEEVSAGESVRGDSGKIPNELRQSSRYNAPAFQPVNGDEDDNDDGASVSTGEREEERRRPENW